MNCVVLGPSKFEKINLYGQINNVENYIDEAAKFFASKFDEVIIVPDYGLTLLVAQKYKKYKPDGKVTGYIPDQAAGGKDLEKYFQYCDEIKGIGGGWFNLNTQLTRQANLVFCLGFSVGVLIELCSIKYNQEYLNLQTKVFIDNRCISRRLMPEVESEIQNLIYFENFEKVIDELN